MTSHRFQRDPEEKAVQKLQPLMRAAPIWPLTPDKEMRNIMKCPSTGRILSGRWYADSEGIFVVQIRCRKSRPIRLYPVPHAFR